MDSYASMRSHVTPIPTPGPVRAGASLLAAVAAAVLTTELPRLWQVLVATVAVVAALALTLTHPYRRRMAEYAERRRVSRVPRVGQVVPLFVVWLAIMLAPLLAPAPWWGTALVFGTVFGWVMLTFPHVDGTRALAYA